MKKVILIALMMTIFLNYCNLFDSSSNSKKKGSSQQFLAFYKPGNEQVLGTTKLIARVDVKNGKAEYSSFLDIYPYGDHFWNYSDVNDNKLVMALHKDFKEGYVYNGVYVDLNSKNQVTLPLVQPDEDSDYPFYQAATGVISDNGMIVYMTGTNDKYYGDQYKPYLIRYNPADNSYKVAASPASFALSQPEKGSDTETGQINRTIAVSPDGRYAYGVVSAFGVDGGSYHWDYEILFQYDFETDQYTRLGEEGDDDASFYGISADGKKLFYSNRYTKKVYDLTTQTVSEFDIYSTTFNPQQANNNGFIRNATTGIYYQDLVNNQEIEVIRKYYTTNALFGEDGKTVYFILEGSENNYICQIDELIEDTEWDTLATVPKELKHFKLLK